MENIPDDYSQDPMPGSGLEGAHAKLEWVAGTLWEMKNIVMRGEELDGVWHSQFPMLVSAVHFVNKQVAQTSQAMRQWEELVDQRAAIEEAIRDYHFSLDCRTHGAVAAGNALDKIQDILGMHWHQGAEHARRSIKG